MDDDCDESMEEKMEEMSQSLGDWYEVDEEKLGVGSRDKVKHAERKDPLFPGKMMQMDERVCSSGLSPGFWFLASEHNLVGGVAQWLVEFVA